MRPFLRLLAFLIIVASAEAQLGHDIARKHSARAGDKLERLTAYRAEGRTFIGDKEIPFVLWAQRPNRLRIESSNPQRRMIQVYDGIHAPWLSHSAIAEGKPQTMGKEEASEFIDNADFDDPLVNFEAKGYSIDYAGEVEFDGRKAHKLLVMSKTDDICFLWVDDETSDIVRRMTYRIVNEQRAVIDIFFKDFKSVAGVMMPHRIEARTGGRAIYATLVDKVEPNPRKFPKGLFDRPGGWPDEVRADSGAGNKGDKVEVTAPPVAPTAEPTLSELPKTIEIIPAESPKIEETVEGVTDRQSPTDAPKTS